MSASVSRFLSMGRGFAMSRFLSVGGGFTMFCRRGTVTGSILHSLGRGCFMSRCSLAMGRNSLVDSDGGVSRRLRFLPERPEG